MRIGNPPKLPTALVSDLTASFVGFSPRPPRINRKLNSSEPIQIYQCTSPPSQSRITHFGASELRHIARLVASTTFVLARMAPIFGDCHKIVVQHSVKKISIWSQLRQTKPIYKLPDFIVSVTQPGPPHRLASRLLVLSFF